MYYIIEKKEQLDRLGTFHDCFVDFIPFSDNFHPKLNNISLVYIRNLNGHKGYILCIKHSETLSLEIRDVLEFLFYKTNKIFVINKKESLYYFNHSDKLFDISFIEHPNISDINITAINYFYNKFTNNEEVNCLIPIAKHYEEKEKIFNIVKPIIKNYNIDDKIYEFKNTILTNSFFNIENQGLKLNKSKFIKYYSKIKYPEYNIRYGKIFTHYNLYTTTGRPSNTYNEINFAALNKTNGERSIIVPEHEDLIELDISGYHPRIIGELINYELPEGNIYDILGIAKEEMFQNIYGGIKKNHPFLLKVKEYIEKNWGNDREAQKQFNHSIQNIETHKNAEIIEKIQKYLAKKQSKLILYTYDAFLFDYSKKDGNIIKDIQNIIKYPTKQKIGLNYHELN